MIIQKICTAQRPTTEMNRYPHTESLRKMWWMFRWDVECWFRCEDVNNGCKICTYLGLLLLLQLLLLVVALVRRDDASQPGVQVLHRGPRAVRRHHLSAHAGAAEAAAAGVHIEHGLVVVETCAGDTEPNAMISVCELMGTPFLVETYPTSWADRIRRPSFRSSSSPSP